MSNLLPYAAGMKIKEPKLLKKSQGQYELIGGTEEDLEAAKQWASFWGYEIVLSKSTPRQNCIALGGISFQGFSNINAPHFLVDYLDG